MRYAMVSLIIGTPGAYGKGDARFDGHLRRRTGAGTEAQAPSKSAAYNCDRLSQQRDREVAMSNHRMQSSGIGEVVSFRPGLAWARKPSVLVPLFVAVAIAGATVPWLLTDTPYGQRAIDYGQRAIDQKIDPEDGALCAKLGFAPGPNPHSDCKAALADLRRRRAPLLLY